MAKRDPKVQLARVERPGDVGIDLPAGATADELRSTDYHLLEMEPAQHVAHVEDTHAAEIERPGDVGMDLPAGVAAGELRPADYHPLEMEPPMHRRPSAARKHAHR
jgi:hypothetical protein